MDLMVILLWFIAFCVIVLFLGTLNYFLGQPSTHVVISQKESQSDNVTPQQSNRTSTTNNRRKHSRNANKKRQKAALAAATVTDECLNSKKHDENKQEKKTSVSEEKLEVDEDEVLIESSILSTTDEHDQDEEFEDPMIAEDVPIQSPHTMTQDENKGNSTVKQRNKDKVNQIHNSSLSTISSKTEHHSFTSPMPSKQNSIVLTKPKANVAPVKQIASSNHSANLESTQIQHTNNYKSVENQLPSNNMHSYIDHNSVPLKFQQQQQETETFNAQKFRRKKSSTPTKKSSIRFDPITRHKDIPMSKPKTNNNIRHDLCPQSYPQDSFNSNGYSSESDILSGRTNFLISDNSNLFFIAESPSTINSINHNQNSVLSTSAESQCSSKEDNARHTLAASNNLLNKLVSIFDNASFSPEELELIFKKLINKQAANRLLPTKMKNEKTIERILEEKYHSQVKILAIELQMEKNRVLELTKSNVELNHTIKHFQQTNDAMAPYQQTVSSYQMQLKRLTDENARLVHQLHAYSMMPNTITELRQQQQLLDEQIRQISMRNSTLEQEIADGERAKKQAAEIYKKGNNKLI